MPQIYIAQRIAGSWTAHQYVDVTIEQAADALRETEARGQNHLDQYTNTPIGGWSVVRVCGTQAQIDTINMAAGVTQ